MWCVQQHTMRARTEAEDKDEHAQGQRLANSADGSTMSHTSIEAARSFASPTSPGPAHSGMSEGTYSPPRAPAHGHRWEVGLDAPGEELAQNPSDLRWTRWCPWIHSIRRWTVIQRPMSVTEAIGDDAEESRGES